MATKKNKTETETATLSAEDEVARIIKKPLNHLSADELTTLLNACATNDSGEIEVQIAYVLQNDPPDGMSQEDWEKQHPSVVDATHLELGIQNIKAPLLAMFLITYHSDKLSVAQLQRFADRMKDPIVSKTVEKALTAKFSNLDITDLKPIGQATP